MSFYILSYLLAHENQRIIILQSETFTNFIAWHNKSAHLHLLFFLFMWQIMLSDACHIMVKSLEMLNKNQI